jgi:ubiquinone/menaquinone biosynthesis C-methylase UbiE
MTKPNPRRAAFDVWADYYDLTDTDRGPFVAFYRRLITERTRSLSSSAGGTGTIAIARTDDLARRDGLRVVGIDEWPWMLRLARERAKELDWVLGDLRSPAVEGPFDLVICCFSTLQLVRARGVVRAAAAIVRERRATASC